MVFAIITAAVLGFFIIRYLRLSFKPPENLEPPYDELLKEAKDNLSKYKLPNAPIIIHKQGGNSG